MKDKQWPKNPNWLMRSLNKVIPNLRAQGLILSQKVSADRLVNVVQAKDSIFSQGGGNVSQIQYISAAHIGRDASAGDPWDDFVNHESEGRAGEP